MNHCTLSSSVFSDKTDDMEQLLDFVATAEATMVEMNKRITALELEVQRLKSDPETVAARSKLKELFISAVKSEYEVARASKVSSVVEPTSEVEPKIPKRKINKPVPTIDSLLEKSPVPIIKLSSYDVFVQFPKNGQLIRVTGQCGTGHVLPTKEELFSIFQYLLDAGMRPIAEDIKLYFP